MKLISFVIPSRNNKKYLEWSYNSIRKNLGYTHEILLADDFSTDGTWEYLQEVKDKDINVQIFRNEGPVRQGIVYWYDFLCKEADNDRVMFFHADMYACPGLDEEILKHLKKGVVVSATRIEPETFDEYGLMNYIAEFQQTSNTKITNGVFAPWAIMKDDYWKVGGHDKLFAPQSKEDSDIFNRMHLLDYKFVQTWKGLVYHMTSRGSRFNPMSGGAPGKDSPEWIHTTTKNMRNFIRKWGTMVQHDEMMKPIVSPKYDIGFVVENCDTNMLKELEPWCSDIYGDWVGHKGYGVNKYIEEEQKNTLIDLSKKIHSDHIEPKNDIVVRFDANKLNVNNFQIIVKLSDILKDSGEVGEMEFEIFKFNIKSMKTYEKELI